MPYFLTIVFLSGSSYASSIFSTAAPLIARFLRHRRRSQSTPAPSGARVRIPSRQQKSHRPLDGGYAAEKEGFEPSRRYSRPTPLAGAPLRPLEYFSKPYAKVNIHLAEREGFEPPVPFDITGFQDQRLQPLGHLSVTSDIYYKRMRP